VQDRGDLRYAHVAHHAAADAGQDAEQHRRDLVEPGGERFGAPETAKSASPAASSTSTELRSRSMIGNQKKVMSPAASETPT
jgi:hypothetical protein